MTLAVTLARPGQPGPPRRSLALTSILMLVRMGRSLVVVLVGSGGFPAPRYFHSPLTPKPLQ
ncbi:MAG TPA: hypothetical protein VKP04_00420 [Ktedonobacteraceae bacterium]|nr:hypothetical protein [Ktedonobacteraceae bacterium]